MFTSFPCPVPELWLPIHRLDYLLLPFSVLLDTNTARIIPSHPVLSCPQPKMARTIINLARLSYFPTRICYRLLLACFFLTTAHFLFSVSLISWSSNLSNPPNDSSDNAPMSSNHISSMTHLPPYGAGDVHRPVVPQAKL